PDIAPVYDVTDLESIINNNDFNIKIACVEKNAAFTLKTYLNTLSIGNKDKILVIIGPEGGFSQREFEILKNSNIAMVSLGNLILRADTAVIAALSNIIYGLCNE
ncbi:RNA methyltransferase, partial [bacterium]|nr:RNA methyltransferase [bacterium]